MLSLLKFVLDDSNQSWYVFLSVSVCVYVCAHACACMCISLCVSQRWKYVNSAQTPFWVTSDSCHTPKMERERKKTQIIRHCVVLFTNTRARTKTHAGTRTHTQFHIYQPHEMSYSDETLHRLKMLNSHLIKRVYTFTPSGEGKARFDKSDMWVDRERWELNLSLWQKKTQKKNFSVKWSKSHRGNSESWL